VPSRFKKSRDDAPGSADQHRADAQAPDFGDSAAARGNGGPNGEVALAADPLASQSVEVAGQSAPGRQGRGRAGNRMLRNWRVRSRLVLLIAIPVATAVALGAASIVSSWQSAVANQRTETLASISTKICQLAYQIEAERDAIIWDIAARANVRADRAGGGPLSADEGTAADQQVYAKQEIVYTNGWIKTVKDQLEQVGAGYPQDVQIDAHAVVSTLQGLDALRNQALYTPVPATDVLNEYRSIIQVLLAFDDQVAQSSSDPQLASTARALASISRYEFEDSVQRAIVMYGLTYRGGLNNELYSDFTGSVANQAADSTEFQNFASTTQINTFSSDLSSSLEDRVLADESAVTAHPGAVASLPIVNSDWWGDMSDAILQTHHFEEYLAYSAVARAQDLRKRAIVSAIIVGCIILLVLLVSLLFTVFVARSMVRPLQRLRAGALEVAGVRLPETVRRMNEADGENVPIDVEPIDVESSDEIGEVARAFDQVHREALRLAATEAALRGNVNAMFVNLSRRSQSLVERQIRLIDELEQGEQDADRLASLFQMDHLATRMRRNSENLLVLAGHESSRRWNQPVPLVDVLRAAISEIEQYERVMLNVQPGISVRGPAVNDVVHLIAELAENATSYSSADTPVSVSGHLLGSGGVLLDITDEGVGMGSEEMAHANWRLDNPPVVDVAVSRRMGLFVVARLAARHGIRVRLRPATGNGLTALVWLPDEVIVHEGANSVFDPGRLPDQPPRMAIGPGGPGGTGSGGWSQSPGGPPSAYDEVAAARARFSPVSPASNGDFGRSGLGPPEVSQPGFGQSGNGGRDREFAGSAGFGNGQYGTGQFDSGSYSTGTFGAEQHGASEFGTGPFAAGQFSDDSQIGQRRFGGDGYQAGPGDRRQDERDLLAPDAARASDSGLGPHRIPGAGPHPGRFVTGPIPAVDRGPRAAVDHPEWFAAAGRGPDLDNANTGSFDQPGQGTGPIPAISDPAAQWQSPGARPAAPSWQPHQAPRERAAWRGEQSDQRAQPVFGAPVGRSAPPSGTFRTHDSQFGTASGGVIVPPPASLGEENRLPIFEAVESDWFRRGRPSVEWPTGATAAPAPAVATSWSSPGDAGWRAAEVAVAPASGGTTVAGLPRRVPQANLIPGAAAAEAPPQAPARSAAATRERFASLQRGMREGRAATGIDRTQGTGEVSSDG
jgi:signal transduction histidine kinase